MYTKPKPAKSLHTAKVVMRRKMRKNLYRSGGNMHYLRCLNLLYVSFPSERGTTYILQ